MADNDNLSDINLPAGIGDDSDPTPVPADPSPVDPDEEIAQTYPVPDHKHVGVNTALGTDPVVTDQGDEEVTREQSGTPDGVDETI